MVFCSMIRSLLLLQLILTALPVDARPELQVEENKENSTEITIDTGMINLGRDIGWIDATCSWFGWGHLSLENTKTSIAVITEGIEKEHGADMYAWVIERTAKRYPKCKLGLPSL
ncbi:penicillin amidase [Cyanobacteria bacterium 150NLHA]|nr:penicillin amidase [Prochlorococcus sp. P1344]NMP05633.1 penicillin amidase [Prochlorococcus sp. P1361]NMP12700.1 penicillin amidase [Prochlorococcus sp.P1363]